MLDSSCGDTLAAAGDHRNRVLRIDCDATGRERSLETQILAERVQIELRRPVRVSALDREVLGRINAAIPLHARDLGRICRRSSKEFGRCTNIDSPISAVFAHQPRHFERRILHERIVRIRQRAIVLGRRRVGNDRLGRRLSRRQVVGGDFPAQMTQPRVMNPEVIERAPYGYTGDVAPSAAQMQATQPRVYDPTVGAEIPIKQNTKPYAKMTVQERKDVVRDLSNKYGLTMKEAADIIREAGKRGKNSGL